MRVTGAHLKVALLAVLGLLVILWAGPGSVALAEEIQDNAQGDSQSNDPGNEGGDERDNKRHSDRENGPGDGQWQEVEVLLFRQWERGGRHAERWPTRAGEPYYPLWQVPAGCEGGDGEPISVGSELHNIAPEEGAPVTPSADANNEDNQGKNANRGDVTFICLPEERRQLGEAWQKIRRSGDYSQLYYAAWAQPELGEDESIAVPIPFHWRPSSPSPSALGQGPFDSLDAAGDAAGHAPLTIEPVYGLVRVFTERYIHAVVDMRMHRSASGAEVDVQEWLRAPLHVMHQSRRMRGGDLHYLDHPTLGILIVVRPVDEAPAPPGQD